MQSPADLTTSFLAGLSSGLRHTDSARNVEPLYVLDKDQLQVQYIPKPAQADYLAHRTNRDIILKSRQIGISTGIQAELFRAALTRTARIGVLAHEDQTTQKLRDMQQFFYDTLPEHLRPKRAINNATRTYYPDTRSMIYTATAGNTSAGRGGTYSHVHCSEVAFYRDAEKIVAGLLQGVPSDGYVVLESSPNGSTGYFYELVQDSLAGRNDWALHFYPWWWEVEYRLPLDAGETLTYTDEETALVNAHGLEPEQIKWRRAKQRELKRLFPQEYPEDVHSCFLTSVTGYFSSIAHYEHIFTAPTDAAPQAGHEYVAGLDFAQTEDFTALSVIDATTNQEVDLLRVNRLPWGDIRNRIIEVCNRWNVSLLYAESNSIGAPNIEALREAAPALRVVPFQTTAKSKPAIVNGLYAALDDDGLLLLPDAAGRQELGQFTASQTAAGNWQYEAANGGHDDTVIARMLAVHGVYNRAATQPFILDVQW